MKRLLLTATFVAMGCGLAMAQAPNSTAAGATAGKTMTTQQVKMKKKKKMMMNKGMSNKGKAMGPETGSAKDVGGSAPAR